MSARESNSLARVFRGLRGRVGLHLIASHLRLSRPHVYFNAYTRTHALHAHMLPTRILRHSGAPLPFSAAHKSYVQSLYRRYLRNSLDWCIRRDLWRDEAIEIRAEFERARNIRNPRELARVLAQAEAELKSTKHPDPYKCECHQSTSGNLRIHSRTHAPPSSHCSTHGRGWNKVVRTQMHVSHRKSTARCICRALGSSPRLLLATLAAHQTYADTDVRPCFFCTAYRERNIPVSHALLLSLTEYSN